MIFDISNTHTHPVNPYWIKAYFFQYVKEAIPIHTIICLTVSIFRATSPLLPWVVHFRRWIISDTTKTLSVMDLPATKLDCSSDLHLFRSHCKRFSKTFANILYTILQSDIGRRSFIVLGGLHFEISTMFGKSLSLQYIGFTNLLLLNLNINNQKLTGPNYLVQYLKP